MKYLMMVFVLALSTLFAGIENFFKSACDKSGFHQMRNVDFIYMINLDERPEKFKSCVDQLAPLGIHPYRFSAVNGWELSFEALDSLGVVYRPWMAKDLWGTCYFRENERRPFHEVMHQPGRVYFSHCMSLGAIGIVLSHLSILQDAYDSGYETIWIMEDDIQVHQDPYLLSELIDKLDVLVGKNGWDMLFTDPDTKNQMGNYVPCLAFARCPNFNPINPDRFLERVQISEDFKRVGARYGAYSVVVRRSGMEKLLNFHKRYGVFLPYDMAFTLPDDIALYSLNYDLVSTQPRALSDNGAPGYQNKEKE